MMTINYTRYLVTCFIFYCMIMVKWFFLNRINTLSKSPLIFSSETTNCTILFNISREWLSEGKVVL